MVDQTTRLAFRKAVESTYDGLCSVVEYKEITDEATHITSQQEVTVLENIPCRISFESIRHTEQTDLANSKSQNVKLFVSPETDIKAGSKVIVEQNGVTTAYCASGENAVYFSHREIILGLFEGWA